MSLAPLIGDLALILAVASLVALICQRLRQPVVLGYILAGVLVGHRITDPGNIQTLAELGVIFLMFTLGLEFSFRKLSKVGLSALLTAAFEVSAMLLLGFGAGLALGWRLMDSLFLGAIVSISSTTIIVRALDERGLKTRRFAETVFAILIVEDLYAVLILVALSAAVRTRSISAGLLLAAGARLVLIVGTWFIAGYFLLPRFVRWVGRVASLELLTLLSLALCLCLSVLAARFGYSVALGGFIMGSILAESSESYRIEDRIEPLRDLFAAIFFVSVGTLLEPRLALAHWELILLVSAIVLLGKITMVSLGALATGQTFRTALQVSFGMAQIGEFSFIIAGLGLATRATSRPLAQIAVAVSLLTTFSTPYLIRSSHWAAVRLERFLPRGLREALTVYASWSQERQADRGRSQVLRKMLLRWFLNGLIVSAIFLFSAEFALPQLALFGLSPLLRAVAAFTLAAAVSSPFLYGMFWPASLFPLRLASLVWLGGISVAYFPARIALLITAGAASALFIIFFRRLESSYRWFESGFLITFQNEAKTRTAPDVLRDLAPWDAHLVRLKIHPNADVVATSLMRSELRPRFGLTVVAIQRGVRTIVTPRADELILPRDELLVLGTDEQIEAARPMLERPPALGDELRLRYAEPGLEGYEMETLPISAGSPLLGMTIRESGIRSRYGALVVGIERGHERIVNPNSGATIEEGDRLWIVGERDRLDALIAEARAPTL